MVSATAGNAQAAEKAISELRKMCFMGVVFWLGDGLERPEES
jgi:hypothetical protein